MSNVVRLPCRPVIAGHPVSPARLLALAAQLRLAARETHDPEEAESLAERLQAFVGGSLRDAG